MKVALACIVLTAATAYADEDLDFAAAVGKHDTKAIAAAIAVPFHAQKLPFRSAGCKQAFGGDRTISDGKQLTKLAACIAELVPLDPKAKTAPMPDKIDDKVTGSACTSDLVVGGYELWLTLELGGDRPYKIVGLRAEAMDGEIGGVAGKLPPMCAKPPPPPPQNVAPTMLEATRRSGDKIIQPDDATKKQIVASGKGRAIGSWKLCIDTAGAVTTVKMLKTTGFAAYDAKLEAGIKTWAYAPFMIDDQPVPVCTAVTFIYTP